MRASILAGLILVLGSASVLEAQTISRIVPGDRVRVTGSFGTRVHTVAAVDADQLTLHGGTGSDTAVIRFGDISRLEVSLGRRSRGEAAISGAGRGFLIGGIAGALLGFATGEDCSNGGFVCYTPTEGAAMFGLFFGGIGGATGAIAGAATAGERWQAVSWVRGVSLAPSRSGGLRVAVSTQF